MEKFDLDELDTTVAPAGASEAVVGLPCITIVLIMSVFPA